ncbi:hypothetical protein SETIT_2G081500v2 [Setaria italica]|uniref:Uncharacterized protein n=1 Tax=Setaria italica TaxID=4555 RepID=A0A368PWN0_SETIT|nr:hypothetical protein SETIT_2G081500v2 [Setaria italica]
MRNVVSGEGEARRTTDYFSWALIWSKLPTHVTERNLLWEIGRSQISSLIILLFLVSSELVLLPWFVKVNSKMKDHRCGEKMPTGGICNVSFKENKRRNLIDTEETKAVNNTAKINSIQDTLFESFFNGSSTFNTFCFSSLMEAFRC